MITQLQNQPFNPPWDSTLNPEPTIIIRNTDKGWKEAYEHWLKGEFPTNSNAWEKGVYAQ